MKSTASALSSDGSMDSAAVSGEDLFGGISVDSNSMRDRLPPELFDVIQDPILVLDSEGIILEGNPAACQLLMHSHSEIIGQSLGMVLEEEQLRDLLESLTSQESDKPQGTLSLKRWDGSRRQLEYVAILDRFREQAPRAVSPSATPLSSDLLSPSAPPAPDSSRCHLPPSANQMLILRDITPQQQAAAALKHHLRLNRLVASIATHFIDFSPASLASNIDKALQSVGELLKVDAACLFLFGEDRSTFTLKHAWINTPNRAPISSIRVGQKWPRTRCVWSTAVLASGNVLQVHHAYDAPPLARSDQETWKGWRWKSLLAVPLVSRGDVFGWIAIARNRDSRRWQEADQNTIQTLGEIFSHAHQHLWTTAALKESQERYSLAIRGAGVGLWDWRVGSNEVYYSPLFKEMLGYGDEDFPNTFDSWHTRVHPDDIERVISALNAHLTENVPYDEEYRFQCKDGSFRWIKARGASIREGEGKGQATRMSGSITDISVRRATEAALQQSQRTNSAILNAIPDLIVRMRKDGTVMSFIPPQSFPYLFTEGVEEPSIFDVLPQEIAHRRLEETVIALENNQVRGWEYQITIAGKDYFREDRIAPISADEVLVIVRDITDRKSAEQTLQTLNRELEKRVRDRTQELRQTNQVLKDEIQERKQAQQALAENQQMLSGILNSADEAIISVDETQTIQLFSEGASRIFGYRADEALGQSLSLLLPPRYWEAHNQHVQAFGHAEQISRQMADRQEVYGRRKNGEIFPAEASISQLRTHNHQFFTAILKDISDRQAIQRMKNEFVSVVSHELRTPLTSVHGSLKLLATGRLGDLTNKGQQLLDIAVKNTDRLSRLVDDVLDLERIQSGKVAMAQQLCDAAELVTQAADVMRAMAEQEHIHLSLSLVSITVFADPDHILQTLTNLISNAIKFSDPHSTVELTVLEGTSEVLFVTRDYGRGIPEDKLESIFERFQQVDVSDSRQRGGTGLGLAICREIVERHDGWISVESELGEGSTFTFALPKPERSETK